MISFYLFAITCAFAGISAQEGAKCKLKDPNVNECIRNILQEAVRNSGQGSRKYDIPTLDPYFLAKLVMSPSKNVNGVLIELKNSTVRGFSNAIVTKVESDPEHGMFDLHFKIPKQTIDSTYNLTGKIFSIPMNGNGKSLVILSDLQILAKIRGKLTDKHLNIKTANLHIKPKHLSYHFEKLFKENKEMGDIVNRMLNDNWKEAFEKLKPKLEQEMSQHLYKIVKKYFDIVPYDDLFVS